MDEEKDRKRTVEVVDTSDQPAEGGPVVRETVQENKARMNVLFPIIGLLTGILQYILLRRYLPHMGWWIAATFLGWLMPFVIGFIFSGVFIPGNSTVRIVLGMIVLGTTVALPQWWLLRKRVQHAWWWVLVSGLAWGMVGLYDLWNPPDLFPVLLGFAVVPAIATSFACWLFLDRLPSHELSSRT